MSETATLLPFLFRELPQTRQILLTNLLGAHALLRSRSELECLARKEIRGLPPDRVAELFAKSFLSEPGEEKVRASLLASGLATAISRAVSGPGLFIVIPTLRCDHDCRYCQVSRAPLKAKGFDSTTDQIAAIIRHIRAVSGPTLKIEFQGGEPLLAFDFIREFVAQADDALKDKAVSYVICSALGPLTSQMITWASARNVTFSISLDGNRAIHGDNRPSRYFDSFENTVERIRDLQARLGPDRVACVATATRRTLANPEAVVDSYFELGLSGMFVRPLSPFGFATHSRKALAYKASEYSRFFQRLLKRVIERNKERLFVEESTLFRLRRIYDPGFSGFVDMQSPSGVLFGAMVFNYDGRIFGSDEARMLRESTKASELVLGTVHDPPEKIYQSPFAATLLEDSFTCTSPGCDDCAYQPFCGADPLHHLSTQGDHVGDKSISFFCQLQRELFDQLFVLLENEPAAREVLESWLSR